MFGQKRSKTSNQTTDIKESSSNTKKSSSATTKSSSSTTTSKKSSTNDTNTGKELTAAKPATHNPKAPIPVRQATRSDLRFISQLVKLCDIVVCSVEAYLHIYNLAKDAETQNTNDLRTLNGPDQFTHISDVLYDVADAIDDTWGKLHATTLAAQCKQFGAFRALMAGVDSVHLVAQDVLEHTKTAAEAEEKKLGLPGQNKVERIGKLWEQLVALKCGPVGGGLVPWDECIDAVEVVFEHLK